MMSTQIVPGEAAVAAIAGSINLYNNRRRELHERVRRRVVRVMAVYVIVWALLLFFCFAAVAGGGSAFPFGLVFALGLLGLFALPKRLRRPAAAMQQAFRDETLPGLFSFVDGVRYGHGSQPPSYRHLPRVAVGDYNAETFEDCISGTFEGMPFEICEARLSRRSGKRGTTTFKGVLVAFKAENPFPGVFVAANTPDGVRQPFFQGSLEGCGLTRLAAEQAYDLRTDNVPAAETLVGPQLKAALYALQAEWPDFPGRVAIAGEDGFVLIPTEKAFFDLPDTAQDLSYAAHVEPIVADLKRLLVTARRFRDALAG